MTTLSMVSGELFALFSSSGEKAFESNFFLDLPSLRPSLSLFFLSLSLHIVRDQEVVAKLEANMAARPSMTASMEAMLRFGLFDKEVYDSYLVLKKAVDHNYELNF